jgi:hypothetical protein
MSTDPPSQPNPAGDRQQEEEIRALWLRLLRLVAADVAAQLPQQDNAAPWRRAAGDSQRLAGSDGRIS